MSLLIAMQYRSDFVFNGLTGLLRTAALVGPLLLVFQHRETVSGWTGPEATLVMALFLLLSSMTGALMEPNLGAVVEHIRRGTLDLVLLKPADAQLLVSLSRVEPSRLWDLPAALLLGGWALAQMPAPSPWGVIGAIIAVLSGLAAMYGLWLLAICTSFYFVQVDNLRFLLMSASEAGRWPLSLFSGWLRVVLLVAVPVGVVTTLPAELLRGRGSWEMVATAVAVGTGFLVVSRLAWRRALASYTSASS
ncbi:MAG: ABC-2 family transporter protein [Deltaproteobacteria bacterium]|nr:ABC-2 family transporter protein [Deltaproteobacteria bacterium]